MVFLIALFIMICAGAQATRYEAIDLGTLGGYSSSSVCINNNGQIIGNSKTPNRDAYAFIWQYGNIASLGALGGNYSGASGINNNGQIVGYSYTSNNGPCTHAFLWQSGNMTDLGTLGGGFSSAYSINDNGLIVGEAQTSTG